MLSALSNSLRAKRQPSVKALFAVGIAVMLATAMAMGLITCWQISDVSRARQEAIRAQEFLTQLESVLSTLKDAETGQRGFLLTGKESFLEPYNGATSRIDLSVVSLRQLLAGDSEALASLKDLTVLAKGQLSYWSDTIVTRRNKGMEAAREVVLTETGKKSMDRIRALIVHMRSDVSSLLILRTHTLEARATQALVLLLSLSACASLITILLSIAIMRLLNAQREADQRFRAVFDQTFEFIGLLAPDGTVLEANSTALEFIGAKEADVIGHKFWDTPWWTSSPSPLQTLKQAIAEAQAGRFVRFEAEHKGLSGRTITVDFSLKPIKDETGKVIFLIPEGHDISERKLLERRNACEHAITAVLSQATSLDLAAPAFLKSICQFGIWNIAIIWMPEAEDDVLHARAFWQTAGLEADSFMDTTRQKPYPFGCGWPGRVWASAEPAWIPVVSEDMTYDRAEQAAAAGLLDALFFPVEADGRTIAVIELLSLETHKPELYFIQMMRIVSAQLGQYIERKSAEDRLKESQERYRDIFENASDLIQSVAADGSFLYVNIAWQTTLGYDADEVSRLKLFDIVHPDSRPHCQTILTRVNAGEAVRNVQTTFVTKDGRAVDVEGNVSASLKDGELIATRGIFRDITERKAVERRLSEFYSVVSHELRTPLTSIRASLGLMEGGIAGQMSEKAMRLVHIGRTESDRLIRLINDILDMKKIEAGRFELFLAEVSAEDLIASAVDGLESAAAEARVVLSPVIKNAVSVLADADRVVQVLTNLISNAIKYSPPEAEVEISVCQKGTSALFCVADRGPGIAASEVPRLFAMFRQLDGSDRRQKGGTGLGLAICKAIVEQHGGRIGVDSTPGQGSTFWCELPRVMSSDVYRLDNVNSQRIARILIAGSDAGARQILKDRLRPLDAQFLQADRADEAISLARDKRADLIILDFGTADSSLFDLLSAFGQQEAFPTPFLIVYRAADLSFEDRDKLSLGLTAHLLESSCPDEEFLTMVAAMLARSFLQREQKS